MQASQKKKPNTEEKELIKAHLKLDPNWCPNCEEHTAPKDAPYFGQNKGEILAPHHIPFPDVFLLGAQKCGTTSLNQLLATHPQICRYGIKEKHFFTENEYLKEKYMRSFVNEFRGCEGVVTMDATPSYIYYDDIPEKLRNFYTAKSLSSKKFILILRDPVSRHYSEYQRLIRGCFRVLDAKDWLEKNTKAGTKEEKLENAKSKCQVIMQSGYNFRHLNKNESLSFWQWTKSENGKGQIARGNYLHQIKNWLQVIRRDQLFIVNFELLVAQTTDVVNRLSDFLGIDKRGFIPGEGEKRKFYNKVNNTILLPPPASNNHYVDHFSARFDCKTQAYLDRMYAIENKDLIPFINSGSGTKPNTEPPFPPFTSSKSKCV